MELPQQSKYQLQTTVDNNEIPQNITHGYTGLRNQGSTCYLNAVLQTLFMTEEFRNAVESSQDKSELSSELAYLFKELKSGKKSVTTENITDVLNIGNVNEQQDAEKWFLRILNMVSSDMSKTFQGIMEYTTICRNEHTSMVQTDHCFSIDISMESHSPINVQYCFDSLFEPVSMCGEDQIYCKTCKNMMNMETNCKIKKFPPVLVLHLERFELDYNAMYYRKSTSRVEIPLQLSVKGERDVCQYDLYAVVKHTGSLRSGHYFADIKSFEDKKWYRFNDCSVHMIPDLKDQKACDEAYLLLYKSGLLLSESVTPEQGNGRAKSTEVNQEPKEGKMSCESENPQTKTSLEEKNPSEPDNQSQQSEIHPQNQYTEDNNKNPETIPNAPEAAADANEAGLQQSKSVTPEQGNGKSCETEDNQEPKDVKISCKSEDPQTKTSLEEKNPDPTNVPPVPDHQPQQSEIHPQSSEDTNKTLKQKQTPRKAKKMHQK